MKLTRRQWYLVLWVLAMVLSGVFVFTATSNPSLGIAVSLGELAISLGVPLMRAMTEHSK